MLSKNEDDVSDVLGVVETNLDSYDQLIVANVYDLLRSLPQNESLSFPLVDERLRLVLCRAQ